jgi:FkbM family methyltransferase
MPKHHRIFENFACWEGEVKTGFSVNFLGNVTRDNFFTLRPRNPEQRFVRTKLPGFDEEYFEWIDLLEAVTLAEELFTMIELGAGYGRWLTNAVAALRRTKRLPYKLIGVEPEPCHYKWMKVHFKDNGVDLQKCRLVKAAAANKDESVWFYVGRADEWYGQAIAPAPSGNLLQKIKASVTKRNTIGSDKVRKVKSISLNTLLQPLERVDLIDLDVQGAELEVLEASCEQLSTKVRRVHIGTHGPTIENGLRALFRGLGWESLNDYGSNSECETPYGDIKFQDGVQTWINPGTTVDLNV